MPQTADVASSLMVMATSISLKLLYATEQKSVYEYTDPDSKGQYEKAMYQDTPMKWQRKLLEIQTREAISTGEVDPGDTLTSLRCYDMDVNEFLELDAQFEASRQEAKEAAKADENTKPETEESD